MPTALDETAYFLQASPRRWLVTGVAGLNIFSTGKQRDLETCHRVCRGVDHVLHEGSGGVARR